MALRRLALFQPLLAGLFVLRLLPMRRRFIDKHGLAVLVRLFGQQQPAARYLEKRELGRRIRSRLRDRDALSGVLPVVRNLLLVTRHGVPPADNAQRARAAFVPRAGTNRVNVPQTGLLMVSNRPI